MPGIMRLAALLALAASVAAIGGCGSNDVEGTIPASEAAQLNADSGRDPGVNHQRGLCRRPDKRPGLRRPRQPAPEHRGVDLKDTLRDAGDNLEQQLQQQCAAGATGATGQQPASPERSTTKETSTTSTPTTTDSTTTTTPEQPAGPPGNGNGNANGSRKRKRERPGHGELGDRKPRRRQPRRRIDGRNGRRHRRNRDRGRLTWAPR